MLPEARRRDLLRYLERHGSASINELSQRYHVSSMTIRRDLARLQDAGIVALTHGGAVFNASRRPRRPTPSPASRAIARYAAASFVNDGDVIFLDSSAATLAMASWLIDKRDLTIVSNSLAVVDALVGQLHNGAVLCSGGSLQAETGALTGPLAERFFAGFFARTAFISADGLDIKAGLTATRLPEAGVKMAMMAAAQRVIALQEARTIGGRAALRLLPIDEIQTVVSDSGLAGKKRKQLKKAGIDLHIAKGR